jgi:hypothetical protein
LSQSVDLLLLVLHPSPHLPLLLLQHALVLLQRSHLYLIRRPFRFQAIELLLIRRTSHLDPSLLVLQVLQAVLALEVLLSYLIRHLALWVTIQPTTLKLFQSPLQPKHCLVGLLQQVLVPLRQSSLFALQLCSHVPPPIAQTSHLVYLSSHAP